MKRQSTVGSRQSAVLCCACCLLLAGCVKRSIVVESDPPGASVWINEHAMGRTPATYEFITHGRYKIRIQRAGFQELTAREMVRAPIYQWIPLDFVSEYLLPFHFEDLHRFRYQLIPKPLKEQLQVESSEDLKQIVAQLNDPNPEKRRVACISLARHRDPSTASAALEATRDPDPKVRAAALGALRGIQGPEATQRLLEALGSDPDRMVRWQAAVELEALGSSAAVPGLIQALQDRDLLVRAGAAEALKRIPDRRAVPALIRALKDSDTSVRRAAPEALGLIGDRTAVPALMKALFQHDLHVRRKAVGALARLRDPASGPALVRTFTDWDPKVRQVATDALIDFGDHRVVPMLIRRLRGFRPWTREHSARALGGLKDQRAVEPLARAFRREADPPASDAMITALQSLGAKLDETWLETQRFRQEKGKQQEQKRKAREKKRSGHGSTTRY